MFEANFGFSWFGAADSVTFLSSPDLNVTVFK